MAVVRARGTAARRLRGQRRRSSRRTLIPRTLRGRLIAGLVALLAVACATVGVVTYFAVAVALRDELNNEVQTATGLALHCWGSQGSPSPGNSDNSGSGQSDSQASPQGSDDSVAGANSSLSSSSSSALGSCNGLAEGTFVASETNGHWTCKVVPTPSAKCKLTSADKKTLQEISPDQVPTQSASSASNPQYTVNTRYLAWLQGTYLMTAASNPDADGDGDSSVYFTGLPLSPVHDELSDIARDEAIVFGAVLVFAGVLGTLWVRFSLRPLRRVATTASHVAELPLESGEVSLPAGVPDTDPATETGRVGLAFNRMLGHVEAALRRRAASEARLRRFAADASHELRTPLAAIRGYTELALRHPGDSPEEVTHALGRVLSESTRMSVLVDDLLLLARLDAGRPLNREPVDVTRLAIEATSDAQVARPSHRWVLELPDDPVLVRGDEHRLHQVLVNLLSNAGRHTPYGTTVTVRVSDALPEGEPGTETDTVTRGTLPPVPRLVLTVTDDGPGIPASLLPDLFERFTRADTSRSHAPDASSTGLGLAIVDAVVTAHQGAVLVTSRPGMTRFTLVLAQLAEPPAPSASSPPARTGRRLPCPCYSEVATGSATPATPASDTGAAGEAAATCPAA